MSPQHLKDARGNENSEHSMRLLNSLSRFCTFIIHANVPTHFHHLFFGASLTRLAKKDIGIRPIAVGLMLRRLARKIINKRVMSIMGEEISTEPARIRNERWWRGSCPRSEEFSGKANGRSTSETGFQERVQLCAERLTTANSKGPATSLRSFHMERIPPSF